ncbi:glycosyltransferase family 2 protein [Pararhodospirillum oryzae]|uniref:Glycosyltransferase 2-like domain-containing protein n=1 Tax=Pararhodospirillum oryzae TaxID=478448 RepID=A0A512HBL8_9PROT|nr:glycosyltransferase family 2 protein [Pararhodospirillum oryzae]GEO82841.1 hypothetical protein ROR02_29720 [Pararhodospirillum oryzae]
MNDTPETTDLPTDRGAGMSPPPRISVVIPAYNRAALIGRAVRSVLAQDVPVHEILVVDDGSSDDLAGALAPFGAGVRVLRHAINQGAAAARNTGLAAARGSMIAFLDSDDAWKPGKLAAQLAFMQGHGLTISCTGFELVAPTPGAEPRAARRPYASRLTAEDVAWGCYTSPGSTLIAAREALLACGGYDTAFPRYEDWDLLVRLEARFPGALGFCPAVLATIHLGGRPAPALALAGLERMEARHGSEFRARSRRLTRSFQAGLAFNRAATWASAGQPARAVGGLLRCFSLAPWGNGAVWAILADRVRRRKEAARPSSP